MKNFRPSNYNEYLLAEFAQELNYTECLECSSSFSPDNTSSEQGWKETQISGLCENCFDDIFCEEMEEEASIDMKIKDMKELGEGN